MNVSAIRNWLGLYFLLLTATLGAYMLIAGGSPLLPIERREAIGVFQILIPVLVGQLTIIFQWFGSERPDDSDRQVNLPAWVVTVPPVLVALIFCTAVVVLVLGNWGDGQPWTMGPDSFKGVVTFCVSLLNATSVFIIARFFNPPAKQEPAAPP